MTVETMPDPDGALPVDLEAARARAWAEHQRRCGDNESYTDGFTAEALIERVEGQHRTHSRLRQSGQDYAVAVSSGEGPPSVDGSLDDADSAVGRELSWVAVLPECDRRLFAEEMSRLMAEAAETDDLAPVEQALREWRVTAEIYSDPELAQRLTGPLVANGERVPAPIV